MPPTSNSGVVFMTECQFILPDDRSPDIYFREGYVDVSELAEGIRVEVEVEQGSRGPRARSIRVVA